MNKNRIAIIILINLLNYLFEKLQSSQINHKLSHQQFTPGGHQQNLHQQLVPTMKANIVGGPQAATGAAAAGMLNKQPGGQPVTPGMASATNAKSLIQNNNQSNQMNRSNTTPQSAAAAAGGGLLKQPPNLNAASANIQQQQLQQPNSPHQRTLANSNNSSSSSSLQNLKSMLKSCLISFN